MLPPSLDPIFHLLAVQQTLQERNTKTPRNPVFREYYEKKKSEGKTSGQAIICIARRLVNIIWGMMKNKSEYKMPELEFKPTLTNSKKGSKTNLSIQNTK